MHPKNIKSFITNGTTQVTSFLEAFRDFALRGSVVDMAVGIIIGSSFNKIVSSLVSDILMPPIGLLMAGTSFADYTLTLRNQVTDDAGNVVKEKVVMGLGTFIQHVIDFMIVAFALFLVIQTVYKLKEKMRKEEEAEEETQEKLLRDIRDTLKKQASK